MIALMLTSLEFCDSRCLSHMSSQQHVMQTTTRSLGLQVLCAMPLAITVQITVIISLFMFFKLVWFQPSMCTPHH